MATGIVSGKKIERQSKNPAVERRRLEEIKAKAEEKANQSAQQRIEQAEEQASIAQTLKEAAEKALTIAEQARASAEAQVAEMTQTIIGLQAKVDSLQESAALQNAKAQQEVMEARKEMQVEIDMANNKHKQVEVMAGELRGQLREARTVKQEPVVVQSPYPEIPAFEVTPVRDELRNIKSAIVKPILNS